VHQPLVSIVMPAYNAAPYVGEALASCLGQTWSRLEVVLVDDGSTDGTLEVARSLASARLKIVAGQHRGQSAAINRGLAEAQGTLIKTFDADDVLPADCVARQVARLQGCNDVVATCTYRPFRGSIGRAEAPADVVRRDMTGLDWLMASLCPDRTAGHSARLIPRPVLERAGGWDETLSVHNDYEMLARVAPQAREVRFTPGAFYYYRADTPASLSRQTTPAAIESAERSVTGVVAQLLRWRDDASSRRLCANLLQTFAYDYYAESPERAERLVARAKELGGADLAPDGPPGFHVARRLIGWRRARRLERWAVRHSLNRASLRRRIAALVANR
jgi:glycosyltransferase involved in cell wall biosynthesis